MYTFSTLLFAFLLAIHSVHAQATDDGSEYYGSSTAGSSADEAGAAGESQPFMGLSKGAQIAVITVVVIIGLAGLAGTIAFYFHRRRSLDSLYRRSMLPIPDRVGTTTTCTKEKRPASESSSESASHDLEKGNTSIRSEFESETPQLPMWKKVWGKK